MSSAGDIVRVTEIGWKAHAALQRTGGVTRVVTALSESVYLEADGTLVWLGRAGTALHPRAMLTEEPLVVRGEVVGIECAAATPWRAAPLVLTGVSAAEVRHGAAALRAAIVSVAAPDGLGLLLLDEHRQEAVTRPETIALLNRAAPAAAALSRACIENDPDAATEAATRLLGLGPGLTPSGDDFVGGALFARTPIAGLTAGDTARWSAAGREIVRRARDLTHPISVALLADMSEGDGHAPLHAVAAALATRDGATAIDAARRLVRIGHSSGWDMLSGFLAAVTTL